MYIYNGCRDYLFINKFLYTLMIIVDELWCRILLFKDIKNSFEPTHSLGLFQERIL